MGYSFSFGLGGHPYDIPTDLSREFEEAQRMKGLYNSGNLEHLESLECLQAYTNQFQTRGSVILVTDNKTHGNDYISNHQGPWVTPDWICGSNSCGDFLKAHSANNANNWTIRGNGTTFPVPYLEDGTIDPEKYHHRDVDYRVAYCLSEPQPERCRLQCSLIIAIIVIVFNTIKAVSMFRLLSRIDVRVDRSPLLSIGDTIASYLERSDEYTKNMCLATLNSVRRVRWVNQKWNTRPREYHGQRSLRFRVASRTRWVGCGIL